LRVRYIGQVPIREDEQEGGFLHFFVEGGIWSGINRIFMGFHASLLKILNTLFLCRVLWFLLCRVGVYDSRSEMLSKEVSLVIGPFVP
jgi:hypothetical protein